MNEELVERARLAVALGQEALGLLMAADGPIDAIGEPALETPARSRRVVAARPHRHPAVRRADRRRRARRGRQLEGLGAQVRASFEPQYITPSGLFQPPGTWRAVVAAAIPIFDGGRRGAVKAAPARPTCCRLASTAAKASCAPAPACAPPG